MSKAPTAFYAVADSGAEVGPFDDWTRALVAAGELVREHQAPACVWARQGKARHELILELAEEARTLRVFAPWLWPAWR